MFPSTGAACAGPGPLETGTILIPGEMSHSLVACDLIVYLSTEIIN